MNVIPGFDGYLATRLGEIYSLKTEKFLKKQINRQGYYIVGLYQNGRPTRQRVHRLVALAYLANPENKLFVNHIDCDKMNNVATNLEWCTKLENEAHKVRLGRQAQQKGESHGRAKLTNADVWNIRYIYSLGGSTMKDLAEQYKVARSSISRILSNKGWNV